MFKLSKGCLSACCGGYFSTHPSDDYSTYEGVSVIFSVDEYLKLKKLGGVGQELADLLEKHGNNADIINFTGYFRDDLLWKNTYLPFLAENGFVEEASLAGENFHDVCLVGFVPLKTKAKQS